MNAPHDPLIELYGNVINASLTMTSSLDRVMLHGIRICDTLERLRKEQFPFLKILIFSELLKLL